MTANTMIAILFQSMISAVAVLSSARGDLEFCGISVGTFEVELVCVGWMATFAMLGVGIEAMASGTATALFCPARNGVNVTFPSVKSSLKS